MAALPEFGTPRENEERRDGACAVVFNPETALFAIGKPEESGFYWLFGGGLKKAENPREGVLREVVEESGLHDFSQVELLGEAMAHYRNPLRQVNRVTKLSGYLLVLNSTDTLPVRLEEHEKFSLAWVSRDELLASWAAHNAENDLDHWIYFLGKAEAKLKELGI